MTSTVLPRHSLKTRITLSTLAIFILSLWALSYYGSQMLQEDMQRLLGEQQLSTVSYVAAEIHHELGDRLDALTTVAATVSPAILGNTAALQTLLEQRPLLQRLFNGGIIAHRLDGTAMVDSVPSAGRIGVNYMDVDCIATALQAGKATIGRPVIGRTLRAPVLPMAVPIRDAQGQVIGALVGVTDLGKANFLDKITENRYGKTGGYLLVAPQQRLVVTATDKSRIMEALPAPGINPGLDRFIQGDEGSAIVINPQGQEVLASVKRVPVAGWYVAAALPTAEAFAPIHAMQQRRLLVTMVLTLLAGALPWWLLKRQLAPMLATARTLATMAETPQQQQQQQQQPLPVSRPDEIGQLIGGFNRLLATLGQREKALRESEAQNRALLRAIPDLIFTNRRDGEFLAVHVSDPSMLFSAPETFLHRKVEEVLHQPVAGLLMKAFADALDSNSMQELNYSLPADGEEKQFEARVVPFTADTVITIVREITKCKQAEAQLRIAAIAFECQEGIAVVGADLKILRVNQAFTQMTGYSQQEAHGITDLLKLGQHPPSFYDTIWREAQHTGVWQGEIGLRRKNGQDFPARITITAVRDETEQVTHYVGNLTDISHRQQQEQQRLLNEAAHRNTLVREVHHRIKNNLQGITGLLRQFAQQHPETAGPMNQAIGQVQGISVIHGLQGRAVTSSVRLCELTGEIAGEIQNLWQTPVTLDIPAAWLPCVIAESEAVPIALVLNELIVNAVKHGGKAQGNVSITLRKGSQPDVVQVTITNAGQLAPHDGRTTTPHSGLLLIAALMPHHGARIDRGQHGDQVITLLELAPPVIALDLKEPT